MTTWTFNVHTEDGKVFFGRYWWPDITTTAYLETVRISDRNKVAHWVAEARKFNFPDEAGWHCPTKG